MINTSRICLCVLLLAVLTFVYIAGCDRMDSTNPMLTNPDDESVMKIAIQVATDLGIDGGEITISKGDFVYSQPLEFEEGQVTVVFPGLQPGIWYIEVVLWDEDGFILYEGDGEAEVLGNETTTANIVLMELTGELEVIIELPTEAFTLIILPDTQYYSQTHHQVFHAQTQWIVDSQVERNIVYVSHLGDIVENGDNGGDDSEWQVADAAMSRLETVLLPDGIPFGLAVGNHDQTPPGPNGTTIFYNQYFGDSRFADRPYYGGHFGENNDNHYSMFSAGNMDFIVVYFEYDQSPEQIVLDWAQDILISNANHRAIVVTHHLMGTGNPGSFSSQGQAIYNELKDCPNLFLMVGGHVNGEGYRHDTFQGHTVHSLLSDYQFFSEMGYLRIMEFVPAQDEIRVMTYSPYVDAWQTDLNSNFTIYYEMDD